MSNQVYSDQIVSSWQNKEKYYAMKGNNRYAANAVGTIGNSSSPAFNIGFPNIVKVYDNGVNITSNNAGISFLIEGMYSISLSLIISITTTEEPTQAYESTLTLVDSSYGGNLFTQQIFLPILPENSTFVTTMNVNFTGYFINGQQIRINIHNDTTGAQYVVGFEGGSGSPLIISKIY